jgi:16S rRNA (adenine1518-N6/adenine1519-N6)-dimethyltransferase
VKAKRRFGQNFLRDPGIVRSIVRCINPSGTQTLVEIGPGQGALTGLLLEQVGCLAAIEIDEDLLPPLRQRFEPKGLRLIAQDVLTVHFDSLASQLQTAKLRVVGNLPYNISSPVLFHLLTYCHVIEDQTFMLQEEVVDRMVAAPGSKTYGRLSVMLQARYDMEKCLHVPPESFWPVPKVQSAVVRMTPLPAESLLIKDWQVFGRLVTQAFSSRRKMIRNTLADQLLHLDLQALGVDARQRPEELSVIQYAGLSNQLTDSKVTPLSPC